MIKEFKAITSLDIEENDFSHDYAFGAAKTFKALLEAGVPCELKTQRIVDSDIEYDFLKGARFAFAPTNKDVARKLFDDETILFYNISGANGFSIKDLAPVLQYVDYFTPNDADALELTDTDNCAAALRELGKTVKTPIINLGEQGALALVDGRVSLVPAVSSFRAGDDYNFLAGFMYGVYKNASLEKCMRYANVFSALSDTEITESRVEKMMREYR